MSVRKAAERSQWAFLALVFIGVVLARPLGDLLGRPFAPASWELCPISAEQQALLDADGDTELRIEVDGQTARVWGTMTEAVPCKIRALRDAHPDLRILVLGNINGTIDEDATMDAALMINRWGLDTHVADGAKIASGGVTLFLGGVRRSIGEGAELGVHSWAYTDDGVEGRSLPAEHPEHQVYLDFYDRIGMQQEFYWFTLAVAGAEEIHVMTRDEIERFRMANERAPRVAVH